MQPRTLSLALLLATLLPAALSVTVCDSEGNDRFFWHKGIGGDDTCFYLYRTSVSWDAARGLCAQHGGGDLASFDSDAKIQAANSLASRCVDACGFFLGGGHMRPNQRSTGQAM
jgi:hypothetical protein